MCVFFGDLVFPEAAAVAMLIKAQSVALSAPFLDLHAGHVSPSSVGSDSPFLGKATLKDICYIARKCGHPLTQDQYAVAKYVVGFKSGFCGLSGPGGCGKTIILASCILSCMKYLQKNEKIAFLSPKNDMKFAAVDYLRRLLSRLQPNADLFQIAGFGRSSADLGSESSYILDAEAERQMRLALKKFTDSMEESIAELANNAGGTVPESDSWCEYKALAGRVLALRAEYVVARGSSLQQMFHKAKVFCGTFDSFNTTFLRRNRIYIYIYMGHFHFFAV